MKYTIEQVMPTGETHEMYGTEYHIKMAEDERAFKMWYKSQPAVGQVQEGTIEDSKWGPKFKKQKQEFTAHTESNNSPKRTYGAVQADKNDGQRQGMCFNNAASFVAATLNDEKLNPADWANRVYMYAQALYSRGNLTQGKPADEPIDLNTDLKAPTQAEIDEANDKLGLNDEEAKTVNEIFG